MRRTANRIEDQLYNSYLFSGSMDVRIPYEAHVRQMWAYWDPLASTLASFLQTEAYWNNPALEAFYAEARIYFMAELETDFRPIPSFFEAYRHELRGGIPVNLDLTSVCKVDDLAERVNRLMADERPIDDPDKSLALRRYIVDAERLICGDGPYQRMPEFAAAYGN